MAIIAELRPSDTDMEQALRRAITSVVRVNQQAGIVGLNGLVAVVWLILQCLVQDCRACYTVLSSK